MKYFSISGCKISFISLSVRVHIQEAIIEPEEAPLMILGRQSL